MTGFHLGAHHEVMLYGFFNMLELLPDIFEGLEKMNHRSLAAKWRNKVTRLLGINGFEWAVRRSHWLTGKSQGLLDLFTPPY